MSASLDRIELTTATLFEALQRLAGTIRDHMDRIDREGGVPFEGTALYAISAGVGGRFDL